MVVVFDQTVKSIDSAGVDKPCRLAAIATSILIAEAHKQSLHREYLVKNPTTSADGMDA